MKNNSKDAEETSSTLFFISAHDGTLLRNKAFPSKQMISRSVLTSSGVLHFSFIYFNNLMLSCFYSVHLKVSHFQKCPCQIKMVLKKKTNKKIKRSGNLKAQQKTYAFKDNQRSSRIVSFALLQSHLPFCLLSLSGLCSVTSVCKFDKE